jgi:uncharacterized membrane protein
MPAWFFAAVSAAFFIGAHYTLVRAASGRVGDTLGAMVLEGTATLGIIGFYVLVGRRHDTTETTPRGVIFSALSGLCISCASILMFAALRRGGPVATTGTVMLGGGVTLSAILAPMLFGEEFTLRRALGVALGIGAMILLARDG